MAEFDSKYVVCPFYRKSDSYRICCEGVDDNNTVNLIFSNSTKSKEYKQTFCYNIDNYKHCLICAMLNAKYPEVSI